MRPVRSARAGRDPAPSRLRYRLHRFWLSPTTRLAAWIVPPLALIGLGVMAANGQPQLRQQLMSGTVATLAQVKALLASPVDRIEVFGASPGIEARILDMAGRSISENSFGLGLDLDPLRREILEDPAIASASLYLRPGGTLKIKVAERIPVAVWRHEFGLTLIDAAGMRAGTLNTRRERPDLPLVVGEGAPRAIGEALHLLAIAGPVDDRIRGLRRVGDRRWDLVLDRGQVVMLPEVNPAGALKRVIALNRDFRLLERQISVADFRLPDRPGLRVLAETGARPEAHALADESRQISGGI
ncbi:MAG: cell division protein FtsQ/DivIB [Paracoccaceae bacterium]|nr:cell division protein FtsQ/DivIB [Paracoccaceae bacterium]